jgi:hypothetical protein
MNQLFKSNTMKKIKITLLALVASFGYSYAQEAIEVRKVDSPYRLLKGVVIKTDLRMKVTVLNGFNENDVTYAMRDNEVQTKGRNRSAQVVSIFLRNRLTPNPYNNQPAIVLDGFLIDSNSPRFIIGQSPFAKVPWRAPY